MMKNMNYGNEIQVMNEGLTKLTQKITEMEKKEKEINEQLKYLKLENKNLIDEKEQINKQIEELTTQKEELTKKNEQLEERLKNQSKILEQEKRKFSDDARDNVKKELLPEMKELVNKNTKLNIEKNIFEIKNYNIIDKLYKNLITLYNNGDIDINKINIDFKLYYYLIYNIINNQFDIKKEEDNTIKKEIYKRYFIKLINDYNLYEILFIFPSLLLLYCKKEKKNLNEELNNIIKDEKIKKYCEYMIYLSQYYVKIEYRIYDILYTLLKKYFFDNITLNHDFPEIKEKIIKEYLPDINNLITNDTISITTLIENIKAFYIKFKNDKTEGKSIISIDDIGNQVGGKYKQKYLKYKMKYEELKNNKI